MVLCVKEGKCDNAYFLLKHQHGKVITSLGFPQKENTPCDAMGYFLRGEYVY